MYRYKIIFNNRDHITLETTENYIANDLHNNLKEQGVLKIVKGEMTYLFPRENIQGISICEVKDDE